MRLLPGRRALLYAALFLSILVAGAFFGGRAFLRGAIEERLVGAAARRGVDLAWSDLEITLGGRISFRDVTFRSDNGGTFEGRLDEVSTRVPLDAVFGERGLGEVVLRGLTVRADAPGLLALREAARGDDDESSPAAEDGPSRLRGAVLRLEDADLLLELDDVANGAAEVGVAGEDTDRAYLGCHLDELEVERAEALTATALAECRVPHLGLESGPIQVVARRAEVAPDAVLAAEPWEVIVTPEARVSVAEGGVELGRLAATLGRASAHVEISGLRLTPDRLVGGPAKLVPEMAVDALGVVLRRDESGWLVERLDAGPGALTVRLPFELASAQGDDEDGGDGEEGDEGDEEEDDERLTLDEVAGDEDVPQRSVQWEALEAGIRRTEIGLAEAMDRLTSLAERVDVRDIAVSIEAGPPGAPPTSTIPAALRSFSAAEGRASLTTEFADHELVFEVSRADESPDAPLRLDMRVAALDVGRVSATLGRPGLLEGHLDVDLSVQAGDVFRVDLSLSTPDLVFRHDMVSPEPVALLPIALETTIAFSTESDERLRIETTGHMGEHVHGRTSMVVSHDEGVNTLNIEFGIDEADCAELLASIPAGLFVYMDRDTIRMRGRAGVDGTIEYELGRPRSFELAFGDTFPGTCRFTRLPRGFRPEVLNEDDYTFRVSEEYTTTRVVVGPGTDGYRRLSELPAYVPAVMYLTEHINFYDEPAISLGLLNKAIRINLVHGRWVYGGSTITQQLVKNLFFDRAKHLARKLEEAIIAWALEEVVSKDRILELYLNCIEFGPDVFGIEAAAEYYFGVTAPELTPLQAAYLAGLKYAPRHGGRYRDRGWSPRRERWQARLRENLRRLRVRGFIEQEYIDSIDSWIIPLGENARPAVDIAPLD